MENLLATKVFVPPNLTKLVPRSRLLDALDVSLKRKLFLLSAPAGFGKTSLVSTWIEKGNISTAWLSLDEKDNDLVRFLNYLVFSLRSVIPEFGDRVVQVLQSPQPPPVDLILTAIINEIVTSENEFVLVLDDYHVLDDTEIDRAFNFLLENMPPQMHVIMITREDPQLPLSRLRARGQLAELRIEDLRFNTSEVTEFLKEIMHLEISEGDIAALKSRTEGWIAGLQLAAISLKSHVDKSAFIQSFTGSHQFIMDFLVEEVLEQQSEDNQEFLLKTAILDRLNGSLCDALITDPGRSSQKILEFLHRANLFIIPLDNERRWYRYHHLFSDLLRQRLLNKYGKSQVNDLHMRASQWFETNDCFLEAFHHAVEANDIGKAESLLAGDGMPLQFRGAMKPVIDWLSSLPEEVLDARPSLRVTYALALTMLGRPVENIVSILDSAEIQLASMPEDEITRDMVGQIAAIRAMLAIPQNQIENILLEGEKANAYLHPNNLPLRTTISWLMGYGQQLNGKRTAAAEAYHKAFAISQSSGNIMMSIATSIGLGQISESNNQLNQAINYYKRVLELSGDPPLPFACEALMGMARISYLRNQLEEAEQYVQKSLELSRQLPNVDTPVSVYILMAKISMARDEMEKSVQALQNAEQFTRENHHQKRLPEITELKIRFLFRTGAYQEAYDLALKSEEPINLIRARYHQGDAAGALALMKPHRIIMDERNWQHELLEALIFEAICQNALMQNDAKTVTLTRAMEIAHLENNLRPFIDEGKTMFDMLASMSFPRHLAAFRSKLLAAYADGSSRSKTTPTLTTPGYPLIEPLSERELEILALISHGCSNREIGEKLYLALNTVKGHNRNLFAKLNVRNRTEAVARARELGILSPDV